MRVHSRSRCIAVLLILAALGCGSGGDTTPTNTTPPVTPVLTTLTLDATTVALKTNETRQVGAATRDQNGQSIAATVAWSSSAAGIATVSAAGLITAVAPGSATMTATATAGTVTRTGTVTVTVTPLVVTSVTVAPPTLAMAVGLTSTLVATVAADAGVPATVTWTSSSATVAGVSAAGVVAALSAGTAQVCATSTFDTTKQGCSAVTIFASAVATVTVAPTAGPLVPGETVTLVATPRDAGGATLTGRAIAWSSSAPAIATVSQAGLVTALAAGTTTITATSEGRTGTATITVNAPSATVASVVVTPATPSITVGGTVQFTAAVTGSNNPPSGVTWTSADATRVTVNQSGLATGVVASGGTQVCARSTFDPTKLGCGTLVVTAAPAFPSSASVSMPGLSFDPPQVDIAVGGTVTFSFPALTHNVIFAAVTGAPANIGNTSNANVSRTFSTVGTFNYQCTLHAGMVATVVVH